MDEEGNCVCPPGTAFSIDQECVICEIHKGYKIENGYCQCALERGMTVDHRGNCVCPTDHGYILTDSGNCILLDLPGCKEDNDCPDDKYCNKLTKTCEDVCIDYTCGVNAFCNASNHGK